MPKVIARQGWAPKKAERYLIWEVSLVFPSIFKRMFLRMRYQKQGIFKKGPELFIIYQV